MLKRPVYAPSVLTLPAGTVVLSVVNSVYNIHSRIKLCPGDEYILLFYNFKHLNRVAL